MLNAAAANLRHDHFYRNYTHGMLEMVLNLVTRGNAMVTCTLMLADRWIHLHSIRVGDHRSSGLNQYIYSCFAHDEGLEEPGCRFVVLQFCRRVMGHKVLSLVSLLAPSTGISMVHGPRL